MSVEGRDDTQQCQKYKSGLFRCYLGWVEVSNWQQRRWLFSSLRRHKFLHFSSQTAGKKKDYLREQCREIGEQPDNKLQNVTSYKTLKQAVNSSVTLHPVLYYLDTFIWRVVNLNSPLTPPHHSKKRGEITHTHTHVRKWIADRWKKQRVNQKAMSLQKPRSLIMSAQTDVRVPPSKTKNNNSNNSFLLLYRLYYSLETACIP